MDGKNSRLQYPEVIADKGYGYLFLNWFLGIVLVYMFLFGIGKIIFGQYVIGFVFIAIGTIAGYIIFLLLSKKGSILE